MAGGHIELRADDDQVLSAGGSMALIERQTEEAQRRLGFSPALILGLWGAAYLFGFGAIFLTYPTAVPFAVAGGGGRGDHRCSVPRGHGDFHRDHRRRLRSLRRRASHI